ncbi:hypothetical protein A0H81_09051 [Grifola frondosa]|uniref:Uncharacterized protein n=1 Tax=Grifola frondosa TaxID=5627 RepID=A0A1C7M0Y4_GRIFR|nr:hypothetical protein A0H81_09051 [Grifola frondosa]
MTQSSRREQGGTERATLTLSSPTTGITHYEPNTPPVRARQPRPSPSPARPNAPQTPTARQRSPSYRRGAPVRAPSADDVRVRDAPASKQPRVAIVLACPRPQTRAPSELSSPVSGVTYEPDFLPFRCGAGSASSAVSTPSPAPTRALPNPVRASASLGSVPHISRGERCECDEPRLICECCGRPVILRVPRSPAQSTNAHRDRSPHAQDTAPPSPTRPFMRSSRVLSRSQSEQNALSPLSALGLLSLREPPHTSVVVHDAASDPRSPIRRGSRVPISAAAAFGRPSPSMPSIGESLIGLRRRCCMLKEEKV